MSQYQKIVLVDFVHYEMLYALVKVLRPATGELAVFTSEAIAYKLNDRFSGSDSIEIYVGDEADIAYVHEMEKLLVAMEPQVIFFNTLQYNFAAFEEIFSKVKGRKVLTIHNINFWFLKGKRWKVFPQPRSSNHRYMLGLISKADALLVLNDNIREHLKKKYPTKKTILVFPYQIAEDDVIPYNERSKLVVIPGRIEQNRKKYEEALAAWEAAGMQEYELCLLGEPIEAYGRMIIEQIKTLKDKGFSVCYYSSKVDQAEFEDKINKCLLILAPVQVSTSYAGIAEQYGITKETGVVYDMIRYQKPAILPGLLKLPAILSGAVAAYNSLAELTAILKGIRSGHDLRERAALIHNNIYLWQADHIRETMLEQLNTLSV